MSIKIALLKSGEDIISDIQEMVIKTESGEEKVVGYFFNKPCIINIRSPEIIVETDELPARNKLEVKLYPWISLSKDERIPVPPDWVVTIVTPIDQIAEMYKNEVLNLKKNEPDQNISINE